MKKIFRWSGSGVAGGRQIKEQSQKHKINAERGLWRSPSPTLLLQQAEWGLSSCVSLSLCPCRLLLPLGKLLHCSTTLTLREFLDVQWRIMCFCLCPLPHVLPRAPTAKSLDPPSSWACLVLGYNLAKCQSAWHTGLICSSTPEAHPCHRPAGLTWRSPARSRASAVKKCESFVF